MLIEISVRGGSRASNYSDTRDKDSGNARAREGGMRERKGGEREIAGYIGISENL